ncbi:MAG TPA: hypothetical protein VFD70_02600 [Anaerolineae bacterium]|nr:hypothetical protein [Anaerolineae bacterium]
MNPIPTVNARAIPPLTIGTTLADRYTIREIVHRQADANIYAVGLPRNCPQCGIENDGGADNCSVILLRVL